MHVLLACPDGPISPWTMPLTCKLMGTKTMVAPLGIITVAALLPREWELRLADLNCREITEDDWNWADVVMISAMIVQRKGLLAVTREAKRRNKLVVVGGAYPTGAAEEVVAAGVDIVVHGEVENVLEELIPAIEARQSGLMLRTDRMADMTLSPVPRFELLKFSDYLALPIQTSRGCPFDCEFCDIVNIFGRKPRYKTPEQVIHEIDTLHRMGWREEIVVADDNFIASRTHARAILNAIIPWQERHGYPFVFWGQASVNLGQDQEIMDLMTAANFGHVFVGVETPDQDVLRLANKHQNIKNPLEESLSAIIRSGLEVIGSFIIGFDGETSGAGDRICALVERVGIPAVVVNTLHALPNTRLWERLKQEGRLREGETSGDFFAGRLNYVPTRPEEEITDEFFRTWQFLFEPSRYLARSHRQYLAMRPKPPAIADRTREYPCQNGKNRRGPLGTAIQDLRAFFRLLWWQGVQPRYRFQFWRQFVSMARRNPTRFVNYMESCGLGEDMFALRGFLEQRVAEIKRNAVTEKR